MNTILVVGYGSIGKRHVDNILSNYSSKVIICTKRKNLRFGKKRVVVVNSLSDALSHKPNIGFVTNETRYHTKTAAKLAKYGMDLFLEKQLSDSIQDIPHIRRIIRKKKLITQIGCNMRFHPCIQKIKELLDKRTLGRILSVQVESGSFLPDWHPYEDYRTGYAARKDLGGGIALTCIHELDYLYWFFGSADKVFSVTGKFSDLEVTADDLSAMILIFKNGIVGEVHLDYFQRPDFKSCKIKGTKGILYWNSSSNEIKIYYQNKKQWNTILKVDNFERNTMYVKELDHFFRCIKNRSKTINDIDDGIKTLQIALNAKKSSRLGKIVKIPA
jgi:predicted dehydrogenase